MTSTYWVLAVTLSLMFYFATLRARRRRKKGFFGLSMNHVVEHEGNVLQLYFLTRRTPSRKIV